MSCNCGEADECDGEHAVYYPLQPGGMCVVRPCHKPFTVPAAPSAPAADGWQLVPVKPTPQMVEAARDVKRRRLLRAVEDIKAGREPNTMGAAMACDEEWRAMLAAAAAAAAPRPAPAEPQGAEAPQEIKSLRDRIIEGELELDGTHPPTLMFLMAEHWKAVATERYAKAKDYDRLKHELRLSRAAPAPQPAGGEPQPAAQAAELEALRADAERYRWLRQQHWYEAALCVVVNPKNAVRLGHDCPSRERLDSAVDAARAALKEQEPNGSVEPGTTVRRCDSARTRG